MANCNFKQGIGLVKEVIEQRSEEVRVILMDIWGRLFHAETAKAWLVCSKLYRCWGSECWYSNILGYHFTLLIFRKGGQVEIWTCN